MQKPAIAGYQFSPQQRHLWGLSERGEGASFLASCIAHIEGSLDYEALKTAAEKLVEKNEILRTTFRYLPGTRFPLQVITDCQPAWIDGEDLTGIEPEARHSKVSSLFTQFVSAPFNLERGPVFRLSLVTLSAFDYALFIALPSLCADTITLRNVVAELARLYDAALEGVESQDEALQYIVVSEWQNELLKSEETEMARAYWRDKDFSAAFKLRLPAELQLQSSAEFNPRSIDFTISDIVVKQLESVSEKCDCSLEVTLQACWQILLARLSGQHQVIIGVAYDGRTDDDLKSAMGLFAKHLPIASSFASGSAFADILNQANEAASEAHIWQEWFSWDDLSLQGSFFPNAFEFQPEGASFTASRLTLTIRHQYACIDRFKIKLLLSGHGDSLNGQLHYDCSSLRSIEVEQMAEHFQTLVESVAANPESDVSDLAILSAAQRQQLLVDFNNTFADFGPQRCLHKLFERQAAQAPRNLALVFEGESLTYEELNARSNKLAHYLREQCIGPDTLVAICAERSIEMIVGILGILKAGAAYAPIDPAYPAERIAFMLDDIKPSALLTQTRLLDSVNANNCRVVCLDSDSPEVAAQSDANPDSGAEAENLAYVIFTSGSTGRPKGVMVPHRAISNRLLWMQAAYPITQSDSVLQKTVFTFDASIWEFFVPLMIGARVVIAQPGGHQDTAYLVKTISQQQITILQLVPSMLQIFLEERGVESCASLRRVFCGGEALPIALQERFFATLNAELNNLYGPTEAAIDSASWSCKRETDLGFVPIGKPIANAKIYLLDANMQTVARGALGELYVGGEGLARGYFNRPELTAERFIPDLFSDKPGERLYRTGDLARFLPDGNIEFCGRADDQVKIRGFRIEPGEIEAVLNEHPGVREAVVITSDDERGDKRLVAYIVSHQKQVAASTHRQLYQLPNRLEIAQLNRNETDILYREIFENEFYLKHGITIEEGDCVLDVGANIGLFMLFVQSRYKNVRMFSFEPIPPTFEVLQMNVSLHGPNVKAYNCGLSDRSGTARFTFYPMISASSGMYANAEEDANVTREFIRNQDEQLSRYADELVEGRFKGVAYECQLRTVSEIIKENDLQQIDLLKVDVEKSEMDVLMGIEDEDWKKIKQLVMEVHDIEGRVEKITALLEKHGFEHVTSQYEEFGNTGLLHIYASHPSRRAAPAKKNVPAENSLGSINQSPLSLISIQNFLKDKLPDYMIPSAFVFLDAMPLAPNGKVNRRALPAPDENLPERHSNIVAPRTAVEELLTSIWEDIFKVDSLGVFDNFFDIGGHSLLATQIISRVRATFLVDVTLRGLFDTQTIAGLSERIEKAMREREGLQVPPIARASRDGKLPLSFAQQRLWFLYKLDPESAVYNVPAAIRLKGQLDVAALEQSLSEVIRRHEVLRTTFAMVDGWPVQVIHEAEQCKIDVEDISGLSEMEREVEASREASEEARRPFDLERGPLIRARALRMGDKDHVLLFTMHHIVSDAWSMGIFVSEVTALYSAYSEGKPSPLPEPAIQYADFAAWQRDWLKGEELDRQLAYWKRQLKSAPTAMDLATDRPRPAVQSYRGARQEFDLDQEQSSKLKAVSRAEGATMFMALLTGFKVLLHYYSGQEDIVVGAPVANRNRAEVEGMIGFFVNTVVMRSSVRKERSVREMLKEVREMTLGAYAHQDLPFEKLVEELQPERDLSRSPLFQVMFNFENVPTNERGESDLNIVPLESNAGMSKFDLTLGMTQQSNGCLAGSFEYNTDLFDASTISRMSRHFRTLLLGIADHIAEPLWKLPLLTESERARLIFEWNDTSSPYPKDVPAHEIFEQQAARSPQAVAAVSERGYISYEELNRRANQLANFLRAEGVGPDVIVGICVERSLEMVIGILGILKAGGAYLPIEPKLPAERIGFIIEETRSPILLTQAHLVESLPHQPRVICLDSEWEHIAHQEGELTARPVRAQNLAYVIYTSGSTGRPKGVMITHQSLINYLWWCATAYRVAEGAGSPVHSSISFDLTITGLFPPLFAGATVYLIPEGEGIESLATALGNNRGLSLVKITPAHLQLLNQLLAAEDAAGRTNALIIGGEQLMGEHVSFWKKNAPGTRLINEYGPTETVVGCCVYEVDGKTNLNKAIPIGKPIANTRLYVLDEKLNPLPVGISGQLYIGGHGLARGYFNRPDLTADRFIPDPFGREAGSRLYKTGDTARYLDDGNIEFLGRLDNQVKIRGYRVELEEIEALLAQHESIREAVVAVREDQANDKRLAAYIVSEGGRDCSHDELRGFLKDRLPEYMIPSTFVTLSEMPLTQNGKLNREALPDPSGARPETTRIYEPPENKLEAQLAQMWEDILRVKPVGVSDSFFEIGGHSLLAVRLMAQIEKRFGQSLPLSTLFRGPTIKYLAAILRQQMGASLWSALVPIQPNGSKLPFFCAHPIGGGVNGYYHLGRHLAPDQPFYGLQGEALEDLSDEATSIEAMASRYIDAVRELQPEGPYLLGGHSYGGVIAFEMAQQLIRQGQKIGLLVMLDTPSPALANKNQQGFMDDAALLVGLALELGNQYGQEIIISTEQIRQLEPDQQLNHVLDVLKEASLISPDVGVSGLRRFMHGFRVRERALRNYVPQPYPGRITLLRATDYHAEIRKNLEALGIDFSDPSKGWDALAELPTEIYEVPGYHETITFEPNVRVLVERLRACLEQAQTAYSKV